MDKHSKKTISAKFCLDFVELISGSKNCGSRYKFYKKSARLKKKDQTKKSTNPSQYLCNATTAAGGVFYASPWSGRCAKTRTSEERWNETPKERDPTFFAEQDRKWLACPRLSVKLLHSEQATMVAGLLQNLNRIQGDTNATFTNNFNFSFIL